MAVQVTSREMRAAAAWVHWLRLRDYWQGPSGDDEADSRRLRQAWRDSVTQDSERFEWAVEQISGRRIMWCEDCEDPVWGNYSWYGTTGDDTKVCRHCVQDNYYFCEACDAYYS